MYASSTDRAKHLVRTRVLALALAYICGMVGSWAMMQSGRTPWGVVLGPALGVVVIA